MNDYIKLAIASVFIAVLVVGMFAAGMSLALQYDLEEPDRSNPVQITVTSDTASTVTLTPNSIHPDVEQIIFTSTVDVDNRVVLQQDTLDQKRSATFEGVDPETYTQGETTADGVYDTSEGEITVSVVFEDGSEQVVSTQYPS